MSPCLFVRALTVQEKELLRRMVQSSTDARIVRRAQIVRFSSRGKTPNKIADILERSCSGVRRIISHFNAEGFASLADRPRGGRPRKRTDRYVELLKEAVQVNPRDLGYPFSCWTLERLREHLARKTRIVLSPPHLSRLLRENDIVYRRPKHGMSYLRDPQEYDEKKAFLEFVKKGRHVQERPSTYSTSMSVRFTSTRP
jgi:transposase